VKCFYCGKVRKLIFEFTVNRKGICESYKACTECGGKIIDLMVKMRDEREEKEREGMQ